MIGLSSEWRWPAVRWPRPGRRRRRCRPGAASRASNSLLQVGQALEHAPTLSDAAVRRQAGTEAAASEPNGTKARARLTPAVPPRRCQSSTSEPFRPVLGKVDHFPMRSPSAFRRTGVLGLAVAAALATGACCGGVPEREGSRRSASPSSTTTALPAPDHRRGPSTTTTDEPSTTTGARRSGSGAGGGAPARRSSPKLTGLPDGSPYGEAIPFSSSVDVPTNLVWVLAIGSDARPGGDMRKSNGDSIHLIGVDPRPGPAPSSASPATPGSRSPATAPARSTAPWPWAARS